MAAVKKILVVDDEDSIREILVFLLENEGYEVLEAENGSKAVDIAKNHHIDLVLSDVRMPVLDGIGLLKSLKKQIPERLPKFVLISGFTNVTSEEAQHLGAVGILKKPFDTNYVMETVRKNLLTAADRWEDSESLAPVSESFTGQGSFSNPCENADNVIFGTSGFFIPIENTSKIPARDTIISFEIQLLDSNTSIKGIGKVAWDRNLRISDNKVPGAGIKILKMDREMTNTYVDGIQRSKIDSFIPNEKNCP